MPKDDKSILTAENESVNVRKISNGYLISRSWTDSKGDYQNEDTFSEEKPDLGIE